MGSVPECVVLVFLVVTAVAPAAGDELEEFVDQGLQGGFLAMPIVRWTARDPVKRETGRRMVDACLFTGAASLALKYTVNAPRPYGGAAGFPSGHTAVAFAVATSLYEREPETGWVTFPLAALVGWLRAEMRTHDWWQIGAGAAIGAYAGHMCGEGQWRLFGSNDREAPAAVENRTAGARGQGSVGARQGLVWSTTVWRTEF